MFTITKAPEARIQTFFEKLERLEQQARKAPETKSKHQALNETPVSSTGVTGWGYLIKEKDEDTSNTNTNFAR